MTEERKEKCRALIHSEKWNRYGIIDKNPSVTQWNKVMEVMYENFDGLPCKCEAVFVKNISNEYFVATTGAAKGNVLSNVFAFKEREQK